MDVYEAVSEAVDTTIIEGRKQNWSPDRIREKLFEEMTEFFARLNEVEVPGETLYVNVSL